MCYLSVGVIALLVFGFTIPAIFVSFDRPHGLLFVSACSSVDAADRECRRNGKYYRNTTGGTLSNWRCSSEVL